ncbi:MAG TPA: prephenate dehydrogenase [Actinomycetota bacterium]|nr:prephenate dehydrogenase [Actinomycetota bacterium]
MVERNPQIQTVAIAGLGLMGGSLGLATLERGLAERVVGFDRDPESVKRALERKAVTHGAESLADAVTDADLVVLATPVGTIPSVFWEAVPFLSSGCVVTDVGSTKSGLVEAITPLVPEGVSFIGGHPMAGSEKDGIDAAVADLYEGCLWILTPTHATSSEAYGTLMRFLTGLGARVLSLDPGRHDEALALTSHLPQLLSSTLMGFAADVAASGEGLPLLTAGGFRDMTRIAGSSPDLWVDIVRENQPALAALVRRFQETLGEAADALEHGDWHRLRAMLAEARKARHDLPGKPGLAPSELVEVLVPVPDRPGVLAEVTTTVGEAGVNIEDLEIVHSAEGGRGVIHLTVTGTNNARSAAEALQKKGYEAELE